MVKLNKLNKFTNLGKYHIHLARQKDGLDIKKFIHLYWKKNHILSESNKLFNFQHKAKDNLNWLLARNKKTKKIEAILGIISKNFFSKGIVSNKDHIWISIIMVAYQLSPSKGLGTYMIDFLNSKFKPKSISAIGINPLIANLYERLGLKISFLNHYYYINKNKKSLKLIKKFQLSLWHRERIMTEIDIKKKKVKDEEISKSNIKRVSKKNISQFKFFDQELKDKNYFINRYGKHPIYKYKFFGKYRNNILFNILICREIIALNRKLLRIVDICSIKHFNKINEIDLRNISIKHDYEYIDFINYGINSSLIKKAGFKKRSENILIPHHFEPFESKNIKIMFSYKSSLKNFYCFKGDSDLDRPSIL